MNNKDVELKVCNECDAPLPNDPNKLNYFNISNTICDDCIEIKKELKDQQTTIFKDLFKNICGIIEM